MLPQKLSMVSFSNGESTMFCSRKIVPPGSVMRLRLVANNLAAIGKEFVRMSRSEFSRNSTSA